MTAIQRWFFTQADGDIDDPYEFKETEDREFVDKLSRQLWCKHEDVKQLEKLLLETLDKLQRKRADLAIADERCSSMEGESYDRICRVQFLEEKIRLIRLGEVGKVEMHDLINWREK